MKKLILGIMVFVLALTITVLASIDFNKEIPITFSDKSAELASPKDRINENQIHVYSNKVVIDVEKPGWAGFMDTNSMDPFLDEGCNSIEIKPNSPWDIQAGDIISYYLDEDLIVHRVIEVGQDEEGIYYIVKGDNNSVKDPFKVRFEQINGVLVAIIY